MNANFARSYTPDHSDPDPSDSDDKGDEGNNNNGSSGSGDRGAGDEPPLDENEKDTSSTSSTTTADDMNMLNEDQEETWNAPGDQHAAAHAWDEGGESETAVAPSPPLTLSPAQNIFEEELMQELRATLGLPKSKANLHRRQGVQAILPMESMARAMKRPGLPPTVRPTPGLWVAAARAVVAVAVVIQKIQMLLSPHLVVLPLL